MTLVLRELLYLVIAVAVALLFWIAARALRDLAGRWLVRHHAAGDAVVLGRRVVYVTLLVVGALIALGVAFNSGNVTLAGIVVATVIASFGVQDVLKNYVSGYYVLLERHLAVGQTIEFEGNVGVIEDIRLRVTLLRGADGSTIVVPNAQLFNNVVAVLPAGKPARRARTLRKRAEHDPAEGVEPV